MSVLVVVVGVGATVCLLTVVFTQLAFGVWRPWNAPKSDLQVTDVVKLALAIAAGLAAVQALVVGYRRQRDSEADDSRYIARFESAALQLGNQEPAVRIAGVHAMAALADTWTAGRQQCVDVLCGYLRLPLPTNASLQPAEEQVRESVTRTIGQHVALQTDKTSWSDAKFDLTGAHLFSANFSGAAFVEDVDFTRASFHGTTRLGGGGAVFLGQVLLAEADFLGQVIIGDQESLNAQGADTEFYGDVRFDGAVFHEGLFVTKAAFHGRVSLIDSTIRRALNVLASGFGGAVSFATARVDADEAILSMCQFNKAAIFFRAEFTGSLHLPFNTFSDQLSFDSTLVGELQSGIDEVLYLSDIREPDEVTWGPVPARCTFNVQAVRRKGLITDVAEVPTGAVMFFGETPPTVQRP